MQYELGQIIKTKKPHACGANEWEIIRTGADFKLKCVNCKRVILVSYDDLNKMIKKTAENIGK